MIRRPPRSTRVRSSAASDVYKRQMLYCLDMSMDTSLKYPKKIHRKTIRTPKPSREFAEFIGIMLGDGGINNPWQANITMNSVADAKYAIYVEKLIQKLFGIH